MKNSDLIEKTVEITVAKLNNSNSSTNSVSGKAIAEFMQAIYDELVKLNNNGD